MRNIAFTIVFTASILLSFNSFASKTKPLAIKKQVIAVVNKMVAGKKTWVPSHQTIEHNRETEFVIVNTLDAVHGFEIPGHIKAVAILPLETKKITYKRVPKNTKLEIKCHMHPAHKGTTIVAK